MDITPLIPSGRKIVTGYGGGAFKVNNEPFQGSVIITPESVTPWPVTESKDITIESLTTLLENPGTIELLIIGCGQTHMPLRREIATAFRTKHIQVEIMTTGAACRTYNVLLSEERKVAAALIAV